MKALAVYPQQKQFRVIDNHPEPRLDSPSQVRAQMLEVGICGTDKEIVTFEYGIPPEGFDYLVLGHESLAEIVETGSDVTDVAKGDLVVFSVRRPCHDPECIACLSGRQDFCYTGEYQERGIKSRHGFMTEHVVEEAMYAHKVPRELRDVAILVEPLTIAEKAVSQLWGIQQRLPWACPFQPGQPGGAWCHTALVLGAGPVGLLGAMKLVLEGFRTFVYSRLDSIEARAGIVNAIGATFIDAGKTSVEEMAKLIHEIDVVYEAVGASRLAFDVMPHLATNGVFIFTGVPGKDTKVAIDTAELMKDRVLKNQVIYGTVNAGPDAFRDAVHDLGEFYRRWPDAVRSVISNRIPIDRAAEPLSGKVAGIKNVITLA